MMNLNDLRCDFRLPPFNRNASWSSNKILTFTYPMLQNIDNFIFLVALISTAVMFGMLTTFNTCL
jgi:hypothetical protein